MNQHTQDYLFMAAEGAAEADGQLMGTELTRYLRHCMTLAELSIGEQDDFLFTMGFVGPCAICGKVQESENPACSIPCRIALRDYERHEAEMEKRPLPFRNKRTGRFQQCRLLGPDYSKMTPEQREIQEMADDEFQSTGCAGEFRNDWRKADLNDGCPTCTESVIANASEPDVMARWGFRRY